MRDEDRERRQERADLEKELGELQEEQEIRIDLAQAERRRLEAQKNQLQRQLEGGMTAPAAAAKEEADQAHQDVVAKMQQDLEEITKKNAEECNHLLAQIQKIKGEKEAGCGDGPF